MTHRDGEALHFNWSHEMLTGVEPPAYVVVSMDDITSPNGLMVLGEAFDINASNVIIRSSHPNLNLIFNLYNANGVLKAKSQALNITTANFEQGSNNQGGQLNVVGHLAKYNAPFSIDDVTTSIQYLINGTYQNLNIDDVTGLINHLLE